jgi:hypothetical protein
MSYHGHFDGTLGEAQAAWLALREAGRPMAERSLIEEAHRLRQELLATSDYVFRNDVGLQQKVSAIREGEGIADLVQDLKDLTALMDSQRAAFTAIDFDLALVERARTTSEELGRVRSSNTAQKTLNESKELRDQVFTWTNQAIDELRAAGLYLFRNDKASLLALFRSRHAIARGRRHRSNRSAVRGSAIANPTANR